MPEKLDYAPPPEKRPETNVDRVLKVVLIIGVVMLLFTSMLLDGGRVFVVWSSILGPVLTGLSVLAMHKAPSYAPRFTPMRVAGLIIGLAIIVMIVIWTVRIL